MEWVETTGKSIEEAKEAALDQLGVDEQDAEFEILSEPRPGLFGRLRGEARVRARVRPTAPRAKDDRRDRRRKKRPDSSEADEAIKSEQPEVSIDLQEQSKSASGGAHRQRRAAPSRSGPRRATATKVKESEELRVESQSEELSIEEQSRYAASFVSGLIDQFGFDATVDVRTLDEDTIQVDADGSDLGLLIGPKGSTLFAIQDLTRTVVQRKSGSAPTCRILVDVGGYRRKRQEALARFVSGLAEEVLASGDAKALEPMNASDRKVVHDTVNGIPGVRTVSEGEDAERHVVILRES